MKILRIMFTKYSKGRIRAGLREKIPGRTGSGWRNDLGSGSGPGRGEKFRAGPDRAEKII